MRLRRQGNHKTTQHWKRRKFKYGTSKSKYGGSVIRGSYKKTMISHIRRVKIPFKIKSKLLKKLRYRQGWQAHTQKEIDFNLRLENLIGMIEF